MEVIMRHFLSLWLVVLACFAFQATTDSASGDNGQRLSLFRALTSEQSEGPVMPMPAEQASDPEPQLSFEPPVDTPQTAAASTVPEPTLAESSQSAVAPQVGTPVPVQISPAKSPHRPVSFYGGTSARTTLSQLPRRAPVQTGPQRPMRLQSKPFQNVESEPTISPYLDLDEDEEDTQEVPTYFTRVLPRLQQLQMNRAQQQEIQQLRGQIQNMSAGIGAAPQYEATRSAGMGASARYMNTGQFYGGAR
jgi:hypothetical protein